MIRRIIQIDEDLCDGCGICAEACHEGAIEIVHGKAQLMRDDYCDGFGDCLPACPQGAISFVEREAAAYDETAVKDNLHRRVEDSGPSAHAQACPGAAARTIERNAVGAQAGSRGDAAQQTDAAGGPRDEAGLAIAVSQLANWPVQIKLAPVQAPYFAGAHLLVAADCCAYAHAAFHERFIRNHTCLIGCPKLDGVDYSEKLQQIVALNDVKSLTICRMEVPCCGGLERMATEALRASGKFIPWQVVTFALDGRILD